MKPIQFALAVLCCANIQAADVAATIHGGAMTAPSDAFTEADHFRHKQQYLSARDNLISQGKLSINRGAFQPQFIIPIKSTTTDPGFYGISNYVDQDPLFNNNIEDYYCESRTYDLSNYNHQGIDFFTWPYAWHKMDNNEVGVVAAADGVITEKIDNNSDRNCDFSDPNWNAVYITYGDGSYSYYGHLKKGSLTNKPEGASVVAGEYLGVVGSSGSSTGPHLHFETYDSEGNLIEPFLGQCNRMNNVTWWLNQEAYRASQINQLATHDVAPAFPNCPQSGISVDTPNYQDDFSPGDMVYLAAYYRDQEMGQLSTYHVLKPDGSPFVSSWDHNSPDTYNASYWYWNVELPNDATPGAWTFRVNYNLETYEHVFYVGDLIFKADFED